jgi:hypothetical protein
LRAQADQDEQHEVVAKVHCPFRAPVMGQF